MANPAEIVGKYFDLFATQRYAESRAYLADRFSFRGPIDTFDNPDDFINAVSRLAPITKGIYKRKAFADGPDVCVIYDFECGPPLDTTVPITELFHVEGDKIISIEIMFDPRPFTVLFERGRSS
jgi:hypothetical protein